MNSNDIFDRETKIFGGRLHKENMPSATRELYSEIADHAEDLIDSVHSVIPGLPPIHFDYIHNSQINALAFRRGDRYYIGLYTGTVFMLRLVIGRMLSDSHLFGWVGNPNAEKPDIPPLQHYSEDADDMSDINQVHTPQDELRQAYASMLQDQAIMFLIGHEIAHITRGHVDYLMDSQQDAFTSELAWNSNRTHKAIIERQAIEADADQRSVGSRIASLQLTCENPNYLSRPWNTSLDKRLQHIFDWGLSFNILFRLFGDVRFTLEDLRNSPYPPLSLRRIMTEFVALTGIERIWDPNLRKPASSALREARIEAESAFGLILGTDISVAGLHDAVTHRKHAMRLKHYWNMVMRHKCHRFAHEF